MTRDHGRTTTAAVGDRPGGRRCALADPAPGATAVRPAGVGARWAGVIVRATGGRLWAGLDTGRRVVRASDSPGPSAPTGGEAIW